MTESLEFGQPTSYAKTNIVHYQEARQGGIALENCNTTDTLTGRVLLCNSNVNVTQFCAI